MIHIVLVADTTGSMGAFTNMLRRDVLTIIEKISAEDGKLSLIAFRDHMPRNSSIYTTRIILNGERDPNKAKLSVSSLDAKDGGDTPEAGFDGIAATRDLDMSGDVYRILFLIGDAPLKGACAQHPVSCECGLTIRDIRRIEEEIEFDELVGMVYGANREAVDSFSRVVDVINGSVSETTTILIKKAQEIRSRINWVTDVFHQDYMEMSMEDLMKKHKLDDIGFGIRILSRLNMLKGA